MLSKKKKKLKLFPPQVPRWRSPKQIGQAFYLHMGSSDSAHRGQEVRPYILKVCSSAYFKLDFPTTTKQLITQKLPRKINRPSHCLIPTCTTKSGHKRSLVVSKWPLPDCCSDFKTVSSNQPPEMHPSKSHPDPTARETYMALDFLCSDPIYFNILNLYSNSHLIIRD